MTAEWPLGLLRLALLELGRRLVTRGRLQRPELALELRSDELVASVLDDADVRELERRLAHRTWQATLDAPLTLGPEEPAPPLDAMPAPLARLTGMVLAVMQHLGMSEQREQRSLHGSGIGTTVVRGRARVARSAEEALDAMSPGDVLVVTSTTPAYNLVLSIAGGVVTSEGGAMCHAAVLARELGLTAVIGVGGAHDDIADGAMVEMDPVAGEVRVLSHV
jgi:pyruvate,water dikinase